MTNPTESTTEATRTVKGKPASFRPHLATIDQPERFNPAADSSGVDLFEHWEEDRDGKPYLLAVVSDPSSLELQAGDWILRRRWAPAAIPTLHNRAARQTVTVDVAGIPHAIEAHR